MIKTNKFIIGGKEIELTDKLLWVIFDAFYEYPDYKRFKEKDFEKECNIAHDITSNIFDYFMVKRIESGIEEQ